VSKGGTGKSVVCAYAEPLQNTNIRGINMSSYSREQVTKKATTTSRTITVEHIRIQSERPIAEVRRKLEEVVPSLDLSISDALAQGDQERVREYETNGPKLSIFLVRDHGAILHIAGLQSNAFQYEIGNPLLVWYQNSP
jgi:hypothetical protein